MLLREQTRQGRYIQELTHRDSEGIFEICTSPRETKIPAQRRSGQRVPALVKELFTNDSSGERKFSSME